MFKQRKPNLNEKPRTFALSLQTLLDKAMPNLNQGERETLLKNKFTKYLPATVQHMIKFSGHKTWNELIQSVESVIESFGINEVFSDSNAQITRTSTAPANHCQNCTSSQDHQQQKFRHTRTQIAQHRPSSNFSHENFRTDNHSNLQCFNCSQFGHVKRNCPHQIQNRTTRFSNYNHSGLPYTQTPMHHQAHHTTNNRQLPQSRQFPTNTRSYPPRLQSAHQAYTSPTNPNARDPPFYSNTNLQNAQNQFNHASQLANQNHIDANISEQHTYNQTPPNHLSSSDSTASTGINALTIETQSTSISTSDSKPTNSYNQLIRLPISMQFQDESFQAYGLVDTGSTHSFVQLKILPLPIQNKIQKFLNNSQNESNSLNMRLKQISIQTINNLTETTCVELSLNLVIDTLQVQHRFIVTSVMKTEEMILGIDFIRAYKVDIHGESLKVKIQQPNGHSITCQINTQMVIPANTESFLDVLVSNTAYVNKIVMFEPYDHSLKGLTFAHSIDKVDDANKISIIALNYSEHDVTLAKGDIIGSVSPSDDSDHFQPINSVLDQLTHVTHTKTTIFTNVATDNHKKDNESDKRKAIDQITIGESLDTNQQQRIKDLIFKYQHVFSWDPHDYGRTHLVKHHINTGDTYPIKSQPYRLPIVMHDIVNQQIDQMLSNDVIEPTHSPWSAPVTLRKKKDSTFRFCVDFRRLNKVTLKDAYPIPRIDDILEGLGNSKYFSTLDFDGAYWQVPLDEESKQKTAFCIPGGLYQFKVMPFGLTNAPGTFQRLMDALVKRLSYKQCLCYFDDPIIHTPDFDNHLLALEDLFKQIGTANLKLKPKKCTFAADTVIYLGHKISQNKIQPNPAKISAIADLKQPSSVTQLKGFMGMVSYYRRYVPGLSRIAAPLYKCTNNSRFEWTLECQKAYEWIKRILSQYPVLRLPDFNKPFFIQGDASEKALGAVLTQYFDGIEHPIAYASRTLSTAEINYTVTEKELLALVWASKYFRHYIYGRKIFLITDHKALAQLKTIKIPDGRLGKLLLKLQDLDYEINYRPGRLNGNADALSRLTCNSIQILSDYNWTVEQSKDSKLLELKSHLLKLPHQVINPQYNKYIANFGKFIYDSDEILKCITDHKKLIVVPNHLLQSLCEHFHSNILSGHLGIGKTIRKVRESFFWYGMDRYIKSFVKSCDTCQRFKSLNKTPHANLQLLKSGGTFQIFNIDVAGPLVTTRRGNRYILVAVDHFSKWVEALAVPNFTAETTANFVFNKIICKFGIPQTIITDQGINFESQLVQALCKLLGVKKIRSTPYHPQTNGQVERFNRTLKQMIACYTNDNHTDWDQFINPLCYAINTTVSETTGLSPFQIIFGQTPRSILEIQPSELELTLPTTSAYFNTLKDNLNRINEIVKEKLNETCLSIEKRTNTNNQIEYEEGDLVLLNNMHMRPGHSHSFEPKRHGPYKIIEKRGNVNYVIQNLEDQSVFLVHYNRLVKYNARKTVIDTELQPENPATIEENTNIRTRYGRSVRKPEYFIAK